MRRFKLWLGSIGPARTAMLGIGVLVLVVIAAPGLVSRHGIGGTNADAIFEPPSWQYWAGTDDAGADLFARIVYATRLEVGMSVGSVGLALLIGLTSGLVAGYRGGLLDELLTGVSSAILSFPIVLFAVLVVASFEASLKTLILVLAFVFFPRVHMLVRAQTQALKTRQFVLAARAIGVSESRIMFRHILPNAVGPLLVLVPQLMAIAIIIEAGLSYVGLGVQPPAVTWGTLLQGSARHYTVAAWYPLSIGFVVTLAVTLLLIAGDLSAQSSNPLRRRVRRWAS